MIESEMLATWQKRLGEWRESEASEPWQERREHREQMREEMVALLNAFLAGGITLAAFRDEFKRRAYSGSRSYYGQRSQSSGMFLSKLVSHLPDADAVAAALRQALPPPRDVGEATARLRDLSAFLDAAIESGDATANEIQPNRALFFVSSWWQIQDSSWIAFLRPARKVLAADGGFDYAIGADSYARYAERMRELAERLAIDHHDLEGLCEWSYEQSKRRPASPEADEQADEPAGDSDRRRVWLISPGRQAAEWELHREAGITAIGWRGLGDLRAYKSLDAVKQALRARNEKNRNPVFSAHACYNFAHRMQPGDIVFAKRGMSEVIGAGVITSDYRHEPDRPGMPNIRDVIWTHAGSVKLQDRKLVRKTLTEITRYDGLIHACATALGTTVADIADQIDDVHEPDEDEMIDEPVEVPFTLEQGLEQVFIDEDEFIDMLELLQQRKNIVLQGPPGTGKTFLAARLAKVLIGTASPERMCRVQFHQSMTYEDFVRGFRPDPEGGFSLRQGPFLQFCDKALQDLDNRYVMIIDEINRGNLSRILGELMLLIEHDKRSPAWSVTLTYAGEDEAGMWIPPNLYVIGTMNTADRSLALVDYALRRRFAFIDVPSAIGHEQFRQHLDSRGLDADVRAWIVDRFRALNKAIREDGNLGPGFEIGHSYFCEPVAGEDDDTDTAAERWYKRVVRTEIVPLLREYWFDAPAVVKQWEERLTDGR